MRIPNPEPWMDQAACRRADPALFDGTHDQQREAKQWCEHCPVKQVCLEFAIRQEWGLIRGHRGGIYGQTNAPERIRIERDRKNGVAA